MILQKLLNQTNSNLLLFTSIFNSHKLKGPASQRALRHVIRQKTGLTIEEIQAQRQRARQAFKDLYHYNYTAEELKNSTEEVKRALKVENSRPAQILKFKILRAVRKFQTHPTDAGSAGVQTAVMSERILSMMQHMKNNPRDRKMGRALNQLIQKRRDMLHYLMRTNYHYYKWVCTQYGIPQTFPKHAHHKTNFRGQLNSCQGI